MALFLSQTFQKNFLRLPKNIQPKVEDALQKLYLNPLVGKKLLGDLEGEFSFRVGPYRIIYFMDGANNIWVETIRHRKEVLRRKTCGMGTFPNVPPFSGWRVGASFSRTATSDT
jgi:mRNA-degrading endonuclease RelE of RelBE toxin-antitoxin system